MGLRISTNVASIAAQRQLSLAQRDLEKSLMALSSGSRIVKPGDDAAGFAISENLRGQLSGLKVAKQNADSATAFIQVAEGGLNEQNNILVRLRELAVQASSDTVSDVERGFISVEFVELVEEFDRIAKTTQFGSQKLLAGETRTFEFQVGANADESNYVSYTLDADTTAESFQLDQLGVLERDEARETLTELDDTITKIGEVRANFGAMQSRLQTAGDNLDVQYENIAEARSLIHDADIAASSADLAGSRIQEEFALAVLAQANQRTNIVSRLLF